MLFIVLLRFFEISVFEFCCFARGQTQLRETKSSRNWYFNGFIKFCCSGTMLKGLKCSQTYSSVCILESICQMGIISIIANIRRIQKLDSQYLCAATSLFSEPTTRLKNFLYLGNILPLWITNITEYNKIKKLDKPFGVSLSQLYQR